MFAPAPWRAAPFSLSPTCRHKGLIFIAGGTGIAPAKALIDQSIDNQQTNSALPYPMHLIWGVSKPGDLYLPKWLKKLQQYANFNFTQVLSNSKSPEKWAGSTGMLHEYLQTTASKLPWPNYHVYLSGPYPMIVATKQALKQLNVPNCNLFADM